MHYFQGAKEHRPSLGEWLMYICMYVERSGSVLECLTRDRRATRSSLTGVTALCP